MSNKKIKKKSNYVQLIAGNVATEEGAKALIDANKDFDMLIFPNRGHGLGEYWMRRRWDYFVRHLKGIEPPKEFEFGNQFKR